MSAEKIEKHMPYYAVLDALEQAAGCPLCHLEAEGQRRYLDSLLYENVTDSGVRGKLRHSKGYCHRHAHLLLSFQDGLGTAILYQDQVAMFLAFMKGLPDSLSRFRRHKARNEWEEHAPCPACQVQSDARSRHLATLSQGLKDEEMRKAFGSSAGLCVPHFLLALETIQDSEALSCLIDVERRKMSGLMEDLSEFDRKNDYRFRDEGFGKERDSWARAVRMMVGDEGVF